MDVCYIRSGLALQRKKMKYVQISHKPRYPSTTNKCVLFTSVKAFVPLAMPRSSLCKEKVVCFMRFIVGREYLLVYAISLSKQTHVFRHAVLSSRDQSQAPVPNLSVHQYPSSLIKIRHNQEVIHLPSTGSSILFSTSRTFLTVSTQKQLATDALWCLYNSVLSKVEPKNFNFCGYSRCCVFQALQHEIHELIDWTVIIGHSSATFRSCAMIIALKWIYKVKLDEYGDVLKNKARLVAKMISFMRKSLILKLSSPPASQLEAMNISCQCC
ncbi:hypothetical protein Tco_0578116 [Tanacetum coccineum]